MPDMENGDDPPPLGLWQTQFRRQIQFKKMPIYLGGGGKTSGYTLLFFFFYFTFIKFPKFLFKLFFLFFLFFLSFFFFSLFFFFPFCLIFYFFFTFYFFFLILLNYFYFKSNIIWFLTKIISVDNIRFGHKYFFLASLAIQIFL